MVDFAQEVEDAVDKLANDSDTLDYVISTFTESNKMGLAESGTGGRAAVFQYLEENCQDSVVTGAFMVTAVDDRGNTKSKRRKYIHFIWVGPKTPLMKKAKVVSQTGDFKDMFHKTTSLSIQLDSTDALSEASLEKRLRAAGGAHQPTSFDFTNQVLYEVEEED